jgi:hypothetical protein
MPHTLESFRRPRSLAPSSGRVIPSNRLISESAHSKRDLALQSRSVTLQHVCKQDVDVDPR